MKSINLYSRFKDVFLVLISFFVLVTSSGQDSMASSNPSSRSLESVVKVLEEHYEVFFNYKSEYTENIEVEFKLDTKETLESSLSRLSALTDLSFELTNEKYVIIQLGQENDLEDSKNISNRKERIRSFKGTIIDEESGEPIQYANIFYKHKQRIGTLSERDGKFVLRNIENSQNDTIVFSILGYARRNIAVTSFTDAPLEVKLRLEAVALDEVAIVDQSYLKELLLKTIEHIPNNYPNQKHRLTGYFHFLEAYLTVENQDYSKNCKLFRNSKTNSTWPAGDHKVQYHQIRKSDDSRYLPNRLKSWLGGSIHELLRHNRIYEKAIVGWGNHTLDDLKYDINNLQISQTRKPGDNRDFRELEEKDWKLQELMETRIFGLGEHYRGNDTLVTVGIKSGAMFTSAGDTVSKPRFFETRKLVINKSNYAIERLIVEPSDEIKQKYPDWTFSQHDYEEIQFRNINGRYYPVLIINKIGLNYNLKTREELNTTRFIVQEVQTHKGQYQKIKPSKKLKRGQRLVEKKYKYDPEFWETYEIPEQMKASAALKADMERQVPLEVQFKQNEKKNK